MARPTRLMRVALGAAAAALLAGCAMMTPIQTAEPYAPSDGFRIALTPEVRAENIMVLAESEGSEGQVFGALVNDTEEDLTMTLAIADGGISLPVPAGTQILLGVEETVVIPAVPVAPGALVEARVEASGHGSVIRSVPVLDETLPQYSEYVPN
ncbi:hypothetical protein V2J52_13750 [Georgenia sp. MJ173]|uniref:hypothetical protein n=1 Tax=Georgenia sunbinii TaxID=3117728 RepID=UPI002F2668FD